MTEDNFDELPKIIEAEVQKRGAMAVEERARAYFMADSQLNWFDKWDRIEEAAREWYLIAAKQQMQIESSSWRRIGPDEGLAIGFAIAHLENAFREGNPIVEGQIKILRRLISSMED